MFKFSKQLLNQPLITDDDDDSEEDDGVFHDTPLEVQAQINEYLLKNSITKAAFARTLNITSNALSRFLTSPEPRADNQTYEEACQCRRVRVVSRLALAQGKSFFRV